MLWACRVVKQRFSVKECDILEGGVEVCSDPYYIFSGGQDPNPMIYAPDFFLSITLFCRLRIVLGYFRFRLYTVRCHHRT